MKNTQQTPELVTVSEASRRLGVVSNTLRRAIERNGIKPDAVIIEGSKQLCSPLFLAQRIPDLKKLVS